MIFQEAAALARYVSACCPQQKIDSYTPDVWFDLLGDLPFEVAKLAVKEVARAQPFVAPAEILEMAARLRSKMFEAVTGGRPLLADYDGIEDWQAYRERRIAEVAAEVDRALIAGMKPEDYPKRAAVEAGQDPRVSRLVAGVARQLAAPQTRPREDDN